MNIKKYISDIIKKAENGIMENKKPLSSVIVTDLRLSNTNFKYYISISGVSPRDQIGKDLFVLGYYFKFNKFSKAISSETVDQIDLELKEIEGRYGVSIDKKAIDEFRKVSNAGQNSSPIQNPNQPVSQNKIITDVMKSKTNLKYYFGVRGVLPKSQIGEELASLGYKLNFGRFSKEINEGNLFQIQDEIQNLESKYNVVIEKNGIEDYLKMIKKQEDAVPVDNSSGVDDINNIVNMDIDPDKKKEISLDIMKKYIEDLSKTVDSSEQKEFIDQLLKMSASIYNRSLMNQFLIFFQVHSLKEKEKSDLEWGLRAEGKKKWETLGRKVKDGASPIGILAPVVNQNVGMRSNGIVNLLNLAKEFKKTQLNQNNVLNVDKFIDFIKKNDKTKFTNKNIAYIKDICDYMKFKNIDSLISFLDRKKFSGDHPIIENAFKSVQVYDYAQTESIPGWEQSTGEKEWKPISKDIWDFSNEESNSNIEFITNAIIGYAKSINKEIDLENYEGKASGYSSGGKITINKESKGLRRLAALIHELAHELLHWDLSAPKKQLKENPNAEVEAESTTYVVLTHFGLPAVQSVNYILLHSGDSNKIMESFHNINFASKEIINNINQRLPLNMKNAGSWFKKIKYAQLIDFIKNTITEEE